jgi:hypothetical protein
MLHIGAFAETLLRLIAVQVCTEEERWDTLQPTNETSTACVIQKNLARIVHNFSARETVTKKTKGEIEMEMKLYEISEELLNVIESEEFDEEKLSELTMAFEQKAGGIVAFNEKMLSFVDYCKEEEKRIAAKRKAVENRAKRLTEYLKMNMEASGMMELEIGTKKLKIQNNPPLVVIDNEEALPAKFFTVIPETKQVNKAAVKEALKAGPVDGAHTEQGTRLVIK